MTKIVSMQACREQIAANTGALFTADGQFFGGVQERFSNLTAKSSHPGDFRRLSADLRAWTNSLVNKPKFGEADQAAYDGAMAWIDMVDLEIENRVTAGALVGKLGGGGGSGWVNATTGAPAAIYKPSEQISADRGSSSGPTVGELAEAMLFGTKSEAIRNSLNEGTSSAGGYSVPAHILPQFIDKLRTQVQFIKAGAQTLMLDGGTTKILRVETDPTPAWRAELAAIATSDPSFSVLTFNPQSLAVQVKASREVLMDSVNIQDALEKTMISAMSVVLDYVCFFGAGSANEPLGLANTSGIGSLSMGTNGATPANYDDLLDMIYQLELANENDPTAIVYHPRTARTYRKLKDTTNQPMQAPAPLDTLPKLTTTGVPITQTQGTATGVCSTVLMGDFTDAILGMREVLSLQIVNQTYAATGEIGFIAHIRADVGFTTPGSFCKLVGVKP